MCVMICSRSSTQDFSKAGEGSAFNKGKQCLYNLFTAFIRGL